MRPFSCQPKGQSLVETALIAPLVVFLLIGLFEVGWALRGYLVLANANREAARFATRPHYLQYDEPTYMSVVNQALNSIAGQIPFTATGTMMIHVIRIDTQQVCDPGDCSNNPDFNCKIAVTAPYSPTIVISPISSLTVTYKYPVTSTEISRLDMPKLVQEAVAYNREFDCKLMKKGIVPSVDERVYVEMWYHQPQLFGFPFISNPFTDPVPMYGHTVMRMVPTRQ